jgi:hypothetical protein
MTRLSIVVRKPSVGGVAMREREVDDHLPLIGPNGGPARALTSQKMKFLASGTLCNNAPLLETNTT